MENLTQLRHQVAKAFLMITLICTGCATVNQKVDTALLEQNKSNIFRLGIIKAAGDPWLDRRDSRYIEHRKKALGNIPIAEICSTLSNTYAIAIDTNANKTVKVVKENKAAIEEYLKFVSEPDPPTKGNNQYTEKRQSLRDEIVGAVLDTAVNLTADIITEYHLKSAIKNAYENAYYGNLEYDKGSSFSIKNNEEFPYVVNVTYSLVYEPPLYGVQTASFYYDINIRSYEQDVVRLHGFVGSITATTDDLPDNQVDIWDAYVDHAGRIGEALNKDLLKNGQTI